MVTSKCLLIFVALGFRLGGGMGGATGLGGVGAWVELVDWVEEAIPCLDRPLG